MELPFTTISNITHKLLFIGKDEMRLLDQNVQCHSLAICHRKRCDEKACHKKSNVTHSLSVKGKDVMRLPCKKSPMSLTACWSLEKMQWVEDCLSQKCAISLTRCLLYKKLWWDCLSQKCSAMSLTPCNWSSQRWGHSQNVQGHSQAVGHRKWGEIKICNVTHSLLVIGKNAVMRLPATKMCNVTHLLLIIGKDVMRPFVFHKNVQHHSQPAKS